MDTSIQTSRVAINGVELAVYEWPGASQPILFAHANSFHGRCWEPIIERLPGQRRIAYDQRGHGASSKPEPPYDWRDFGADLAALARTLDVRGAIGVGHSLGGYATALAASIAPECFAALLLLDPVILPPARYTGRIQGIHGASRRRARWASPAAFYERLRYHHPFNRWEPAALHAYCDHGLLPDPSGDGYILACAPAVEADIYHGTTEHPIYTELATINIPVVIVRGHPYQVNPAEDLTASPTNPGLATAFLNARDIHLVEHTHFIPMEDSALVASFIQELTR
jgi:pimeloyl-ACP methyl ester carboxylesterase